MGGWMDAMRECRCYTICDQVVGHLAVRRAGLESYNQAHGPCLERRRFFQVFQVARKGGKRGKKRDISII
jgi:hypothetical protein